MFRTYFGTLRTGRLARLPFLGFLALLSVLFVLYGLGIAFGLGVADLLLRGDVPAARDRLLGHFGLPVTLVLGLFVLLFAFAKLNLLAKRLRDMGLPGGWTLLIICLAFGALSFVLPADDGIMSQSNQVRALVAGLMTLGLLLIPSGLFTPRARQTGVRRPHTGMDEPGPPM